MKSVILSILFIPLFIFSQQDSAKTYYLKGLNAIKIQNYSLADTLFGISLSFKHYGNVHLNKAIAKEKLGDKKGYCENLLWGIYYNNKESGTLFCKNCGKADTIYKNGQGNEAPKDFYLFKEITYKSEFTNPFMVKTDTHNNSLLSSIKDAEILTINNDFNINEVNAEFPGGVSAMIDYMKRNLNSPKKVVEGKTNVRVNLKFIVLEDGSITNVTVTNITESCPECELEAIRVIKQMPKWSPAKFNEMPVKCYFNLPITFKPN
ncbi:MAG: energy transducer TonB [Bacteroidia bacterium]|nr:energy transducer TonB [Bacteroidia bacterium]